MRKIIWKTVRLNVPEGSILPWWALVIRVILYPIDFIYWRMSQTNGYQFINDTWLIDGVTYSGEALRMLAESQGETYRIARDGNVVILERVPNNEVSGWL
jgi:hypothetical protein